MSDWRVCVYVVRSDHTAGSNMIVAKHLKVYIFGSQSTGSDIEQIALHTHKKSKSTHTMKRD